VFGTEVKFSGDERFWENALILMYVSGKIASQAGLIQFDHVRTLSWQLKQMNAIRREIKGIKKDSMDYLTEYLNEFSPNAVTVWYVRGQSFKPVVDAPNTNYRNSGIHIRFELYKPDNQSAPDSGILMLDKSHFRKWLTSKSGDYREFISDMDSMGIMAYEEGKRQYLAKHTEIRTGQTRTIGLDMNNTQLQFLIENKEQEPELSVVSSVAQ
jgi:hypothetical protein